jgi:hypothetical protein
MNAFPNLVITNVRYLAGYGEAARSFVVPHRVYGTGADRPATFEEALEVLFRQLNVVDGNELISSPEFQADNPRLRSMSVGDLVTFRAPGGVRKDYVCEGLGWKEISAEEADWVVRNVTVRDFFGTLAMTKEYLAKK